ncbi:MAG: M55 family metallopeptidase [Planctomycetota bacterium]
MKLFILTDMEGAAGVFSWDLHVFRAGRYHELAKQLVTAEVNAAIDGARAGGATEIVVWDSHGPGTLNILDVRPGVRIIQGRTEPPHGLDDSFDAFFQTCQHCKPHTENGVLQHAIGGGVDRFWLNDVEVGEIGLRAALAGHYGAPFVLQTGDTAACNEARNLVPEIETAEVKQGLGEEAAIHMHPIDARQLIAEKARRAMERAREIPPLAFDRPYVLRIEYRAECHAEHHLKVRAGCERIGPREVRITSDDMADILRRGNPVMAPNAPKLPHTYLMRS